MALTVTSLHLHTLPVEARALRGSPGLHVLQIGGAADAVRPDIFADAAGLTRLRDAVDTFLLETDAGSRDRG